jgi:anti-sigma B factor antagonist
VVNEELDWDLLVRTARNRAEVRVFGELDLETAPLLLAEVERLVRNGRTEVVIDMTNLLFIDSSGLGALVASWRRTQQAGVRFVIRNPQEDVVLSLEITGLDQVLPIERVVADAA